MNSGKPSVLNVGQCGFDHGNINALLEREFGATLDAADSPSTALRALASKSYDLVLVNRVFDATGDEGLPFIRAARNDESLAGVPFMLVSNFEDAQAAAVDAGAVPGFGKDALTDPQTVALLSRHLSDRAD